MNLATLKEKFKEKGLWWKIPTLSGAVFVLVVGGILSFKLIVALRNILAKNLSGGAPALLGDISPGKLKGEGDGRINILLLGIPGGAYPGPNLTDTIMVVSIDPEEKKVAMLSIPRDLYVPSDFGHLKINMLHSLGEERQLEGGGPALTKRVVSNILDLPIHYYVRTDFTGFKKIIKILGGVKVTVDKDIIDWQFPTDSGGTTYFHLKAGTYEMDPELALKYARSRYTTSDFDRASRQQKLLLAIREKALTMEVLLSPSRLSELISTLGGHLKTDLQLWEIERLVGLGREMDSSKVVSHVLNDSQNGLLYADNVGGMFVLKPKGGNFSKIAAFAHGIFTDFYLKREAARLEIQNGTGRAGLATNLATFLKSYGYNVVKVDLAPRFDFSRTIIYDGTSGQKPYTISYLARRLQAEVVYSKNLSPDTDIKIILGQNYSRPTNY